MIRVASTNKRRRRSELMYPSPARIERLAAEIRETWSPATRLRRAGQARRVQMMLISTRDVFGKAIADEIFAS